MKNLFTILLSCLMISLFLSCSMEPEQDFVENEKETFESLKMKVEAMAQEYGVGVSINESVWRKRLPSLEDIEKDFIRIKELSAANEARMDSTSITSTSVLSSTRNDVGALENKPRVLKSFNERPITGHYDDIFYIYDHSEWCYYDVSVTVYWQYGGGSYVRYTASVSTDDNISSRCEIVNPFYYFTGKSFTGSFMLYYYDAGSNVPAKIFYVSTIYDSTTGLGYIDVSH